MNNLYEFAGCATPGAATAKPIFRRVDGSVAATPYMALMTSKAEWLYVAGGYDTGLAIAGFDTWMKFVVECDLITNDDDTDIPFYVPDQDFSALPPGYVTAYLFASDTQHVAADAILPLYWSGTDFYTPDEWLAAGVPTQARAVRPPDFSIDMSRRHDHRLYGVRPLVIPEGTVKPNQIGLNVGPVYRDPWVQSVGTPVVTGSDTLTATAVGRFSDGPQRWGVIELGGTITKGDKPTVSVLIELDSGGGDTFMLDVIGGEPE